MQKAEEPASRAEIRADLLADAYEASTNTLGKLGSHDGWKSEDER